MRATNPCGEQSLYPYESCNLGSINLANLVKRKADGQYEFDWQGYEETIRKTTRFLDNVIDMNLYPVLEIDNASKESRRIGLGVMGVADLLYKLRIPYNSKEGYEFHLGYGLDYIRIKKRIRNNPEINNPASYQKRNDVYRQFFEECIIEDKKRVLSITEIYTQFKEWFRDSLPGQKVPIKNDVKEYCARLWGTPQRGWKWKGYKIQTISQPGESEEI